MQPTTPLKNLALPSNFGQMRDNLVELCHAYEHLPADPQIEGQKAPEVNLYATREGRILDATCGEGYAWSIVDQVMVFLSCRDANSLAKIRKDRLSSAFEQMIETYDACIPIVSQAILQYKKFIKDRMSGLKPKSEQYNVARTIITEWHEATKRMLRLQKKKPTMTKFGDKLLSRELVKPCLRMLKILALENLRGEELPLKAIHTIVQWGKDEEDHVLPRNLPKHDERELLEKFITDINHSSEEVSTVQKIVHRGLLQLIRDAEFNAKEDEAKINFEMGRLSVIFLTRLKCSRDLTACRDGSCHLFTKEDPRHIRWRNKLKEGSTIKSEGQTITLGKRLGKKGDKDRNHVYEIAGNDKEVLLVAINRVCLETLSFLNAETVPQSEGEQKTLAANALHLQIPRVLVKKVDSKGRFAWVEKLLYPLSDLIWGDALSEKAREVCDGFVESFIRPMIANNVTLQPLDPQYWGFNQKLQVACTKPLQLKKGIDLVAIEEFIYTFAHGKPQPFKYLMQDLRSLKEGAYYAEVIQNALSGDEVDVTELAGNREVKEEGATERAGKLSEEARAIREECLKILDADEKGRQYKDKLGAVLYMAYEKTGGVTKLLKEPIIAYFKQKLEDLKKTPQLPATPTKAKQNQNKTCKVM